MKTLKTMKKLKEIPKHFPSLQIGRTHIVYDMKTDLPIKYNLCKISNNFFTELGKS